MTERTRQQSAMDTIAAQRAAAQRSQSRRRMLIVAGAVIAVLAVLVGLVVVHVLAKPSSPTADIKPGTPGPASRVGRLIATVPAATLDKVGAGPAYPARASVYPHAVHTIRPAGPPLTIGGKPEVVYVGAEYCPYCAAERWALAVALSRFGTFSGLRLIHSSPADVYPSTPTLSFYRASYTSKYLVFAPTETATVSEAPLQAPTSLDRSLMTKYDAPPYVISSQYDDSYPFIDFANKDVVIGASYSPALLAGLTWQQVAASLARPSSTVGATIDAVANHLTAAICQATHDQPASVCTSSGVTSASGSI